MMGSVSRSADSAAEQSSGARQVETVSRISWCVMVLTTVKMDLMRNKTVILSVQTISSGIHINILIIDNKSSCLQGVVMESVCPMTRDVTECQTVTLMSLNVLLPVMVTSSSAMMVHVSRQSTGMSSCIEVSSL